MKQTYFKARLVAFYKDYCSLKTLQVASNSDQCSLKLPLVARAMTNVVQSNQLLFLFEATTGDCEKCWLFLETTTAMHCWLQTMMIVL